MTHVLARLRAGRGLRRFLLAYLADPEGRLAAAGFLAVALGNAAGVRAALELNAWNGRFFDALAAARAPAVFAALGDFALIGSVTILVLVATSYAQGRLVLKVRRDLTARLLARWLSPEAAHFRLRETGAEPDNPDQRILEDTSAFASLGIRLALSLLESVLTIAGFSAVLWSFSAASLTNVDIPGAMLWACVLYTLLCTWVTHLIGRPLKPLNVEAQHREADLRFHLIDKRRHAEAIAGAHGEAFERARLLDELELLVDLLKRRLRKTRDLDLFTVGLGQVTHLVPIFLGIPGLLSGSIALGGLMQLRGAFVDVSRSLSWVIVAYDDLARFAAVCARLNGLIDALEAVEAARALEKIEGIEGIEPEALDRVGAHAAHAAHAADAPLLDAALAVTLPDGRLLETVLRGKAGETILVLGPSGTGKSTLLRCASGFGRYAGRLSGAEPRRWLPQTPYLFPGTLRENLTYPGRSGSASDSSDTSDASDTCDKRLVDLLLAFGLQSLTSELDRTADWRTRLSGGEAQRVALIRAVLAPERVLLLDEATSALDEASARRALSVLETERPDALLVVVTHQNLLEPVAARSESNDSTGDPVRRRVLRVESRAPAQPLRAASSGAPSDPSVRSSPSDTSFNTNTATS